jgi:glycosyltransferase involved in cell wall biosynthesis
MANNLQDFSVLMSVYGKDDSVIFEKALCSVFQNTRQPSEFILIVDGPIPFELQSIIDKYKKRESFIVLHLAINSGLANALNYGIKHVKNDWIIRADADDLNYPNRFEVLSNEMTDMVDLIGSAIREVDKFGEVLAVRYTPLNMLEILKFLKKRNPFNHMSVAFRTSMVVRCGGYPNVYMREDYALWIKLAAAGAKMKNISDILVDATTGNEMYARRGGLKYCFGEFHLQKLIVNQGLKTIYSGIFDGILRCIVFLLPIRFRKFIYENFLRSNINKLSF